MRFSQDMTPEEHAERMEYNKALDTDVTGNDGL